MRLLHTRDLEFRDFFDADIPVYAILSHCWDSVDQEVSYEDLIRGYKKETSGYRKLQGLCRAVAAVAIDRGWIDTCCIDKRNSAELSEAINSMFSWYKESKACLVYLSDVDVGHQEWRLEFKASRYFHRGWTLQELLAPQNVTFYDRNWHYIGNKYQETITGLCHEATNIPISVLKGHCDLQRISVARRMSWAAKRTTSRVEDTAYCLMGIFGVNMPLLYGEKEKAFMRLQLEIMANTDDDSLFAWDDPGVAPSSHHGILAKRPSRFWRCGNIALISDDRPMDFQNAALRTQVGIWMRRNLINISSGSAPEAVQLCPLRCAAVSDSGSLHLQGCVSKSVLEAEGARQCSIVLTRGSESQPFSRIQAGVPTWCYQNIPLSHEETRICIRFSCPAAVFAETSREQHTSERLIIRGDPFFQQGNRINHSMNGYPSDVKVRPGSEQQRGRFPVAPLLTNPKRPRYVEEEHYEAISKRNKGLQTASEWVWSRSKDVEKSLGPSNEHS